MPAAKVHTERDLKKKNDTDYPKKFEGAKSKLKEEVVKGIDLATRDTVEEDKEKRAAKYNSIKEAAENLTGVHRGQLAVPNAWAKRLIQESC